MKAVLSAAILGALLSSVAAFPRMDPAQVEALKQNAARKAAGCPYAAKREAESEAEARSDCPFGKNKKRATFNAQQQKVNVDGEHAWKAPDIAGGDQRGMPAHFDPSKCSPKPKSGDGEKPRNRQCFLYPRPRTQLTLPRCEQDHAQA